MDEVALTHIDRADRIRELATRLLATEAELSALTAGELDAVLDPAGTTPMLLRRAQEALREAEARSRDLVARLPIIACELAPDGTVVFVNDAVTRILGYQSTDLVGSRWWEVLLEDASDTTMRALLSREVSDFERVVRARDGGERTVVWTSTHLRDAAGALRSVLVFGLDLTERKRAEESARRLVLEQAARRSAEAAQQREALLSEASRVLSASLRYEATLVSIGRLLVAQLAEYCILDVVGEGATRRIDVAHRSLEATDPLREHLAESALPASEAHPIRRVIAEGATLSIDAAEREVARALAATGAPDEVIAQLEGRAILSVPMRAHGQTLGAITLISPLHGEGFDGEHRGLVEELARRAALAVDNAKLYETALVASQAKSDFLAVMSHELRTPLNAVLGYADLLLLGIPALIPEPSREQVERIRMAARHLLQMIEEILTLSRVEAGQEQIHRDSCELCSFLEETAALIEPLVQAKHLSFRCEPPEAPVEVKLDKRKVRQILLNLLGNAVKFTTQGEISIGARLEGEEVVFWVADTGIGISVEHQEKIFDAFWQVEQGRSRRSDGAGLGLSVTRRLARLMGGDVTVANREGRGTRFEARLPAF